MPSSCIVNAGPTVGPCLRTRVCPDLNVQCARSRSSVDSQDLEWEYHG